MKSETAVAELSDTPDNRTQLSRLLSSRTFAAIRIRKAVATKQDLAAAQLLKWLAEETMKGAAATLDQQTVANHFAWTVSNTGTVKARLVKLLTKYYQTEGQTDGVVFEIPLREFVVTARRRVFSPPWLPPPPASKWILERHRNHDISIRTFETFLKELCEANGTFADARNALVDNWVQGNSELTGVSRDPGFEGLFNQLEKGHTLTFQGMCGLAQALGVHRIMLDPLLSVREYVDAVILCRRRDSTSDEPAIPRRHKGTQRPAVASGRFETVAELGERGYGEGAQYSIPTVRLADTEAAFVYLVLNPDAHSDQHHHPGDELLLVLKGSVVVHLHDSGVDFELNAHSYAHYYSEQNHSVTNRTSHVAEVLVIRFYQCGVAGTRQYMRSRFWQHVHSRSLSSARVKARLPEPGLGESSWGWISETTASRSIDSLPAGAAEGPRQFLNRFSLARLLRNMPRPTDANTKRFLGEIRRHGKKVRSLDEWVWNVETGQVTVPKDLIPDICALYNDVFDYLLLQFLFPACPRQVVVRRSTGSAPKDRHDWADLTKIVGGLRDVVPPCKPINPPPAEVRYEIPVRSLACSDVTVTWLTLNPKWSTRSNRHPGSELLLPLGGEATIEYKEGAPTKIQVSASLGQMAHYSSERLHAVVNHGDEVADMLVIRFFGERPGSNRRKPASKAR